MCSAATLLLPVSTPMLVPPLTLSMHNWNTLFMRSDAVGDAVASRYGVAKRDLLSSEGEVSAAVRAEPGR